MAAAIAGLGMAILATWPARVVLRDRVVSRHALRALPANLLGNGQHDFAWSDARQVTVGRITGDDLRPVWHAEFQRDIRLTGTMDLTGDGFDEVCMSAADSTGGEALVLDREGRTLLVIEPEAPGRAPGRQPGGLEIAAPFDRNGRRDAVVRSTPGTAPGRRGVSLYDLESLRLEWHHALSGDPGAVVVADLDGDQQRDLVVASSHPEDGAADATAAPSEVTALDASGAQRWNVPVGGAWAELGLGVLPAAAGAARIIATFESLGGHATEPGRLLLLDGASGRVLARREFVAGICAPCVLREGEGFVVGGRDGILRRFGSDLALVASCALGKPVEVRAATDVDGDGRPEVVAATRDEVVVLDQRLHIRARLPLTGGTSEPDIAVAAAGPELVRLAFADGDAHVVDVASRAPLRDPAAVGLVLVLAATSGAGVARWRTPKAWRRVPAGEAAREFLLDYHQILHETFDRERPFARLRLWAQADAAGHPLPTEMLESACDEFVRIGRPTLGRYVRRARALRVEPSLVARMEALSESAAGALADLVGLSPRDRAARLREVFDTVGNLSRACSEAYEEVALRAPCVPAREIQEALLAKRAALDRHAIASSFHADAAAREPVLFDRDELRALVGELLENSARALAGTPAAAVDVSVALDPHDARRMRVRIADNGPGIAPDRREAVFAPENSSRAGGGFGLYHARETARRWLGELSIEDAPGGGAVVQLTLRTCRTRVDEAATEPRRKPTA